MMRNITTICFIFLFLVSSFVMAQAPDYSQLDGKPYDPKTEPNIDMFISSWKESMPRHTHGSLIERDIFTKCEGDPVFPTTKGAVLTDLKRFSHATLVALASTTPNTLEGEQEIFYIDSGKGTIKTRGKTADLHEGSGILMPPGIEYIITNTEDEPLTMYIIVEPIPEGFTPNKEMLITDVNTAPAITSSGHWTNISRRLFRKEDGLAILSGMGPVIQDSMTMSQPHSHAEGLEEIWFALKGDVTVLLGKQLRKLPIGSAYKIPANGTTPHANINTTEEPIMTFWLMKYMKR